MNSGYRVRLTKRVLKYLKKLDSRTKKRIERVINLLKEDPYAIPKIKRMKGTSHNQYRVRIGDLRMIYRVIDRELVVIVLDVGPRGDIYK